MAINIYRIYSHIGDLQYFGSTTRTVLYRYKEHVQQYNKKNNHCKSNVLFDTYGTVNTFVELLETCEEDNRKEREGWYIRNNECVNRAIPDRTQVEYNKEYHKENRDARNARQKECHKQNRDAYNAYQREYRKENRDARNAHRRELYALKKSKLES